MYPTGFIPSCARTLGPKTFCSANKSNYAYLHIFILVNHLFVDNLQWLLIIIVIHNIHRYIICKNINTLRESTWEFLSRIWHIYIYGLNMFLVLQKFELVLLENTFYYNILICLHRSTHFRFNISWETRLKRQINWKKFGLND